MNASRSASRFTAILLASLLAGSAIAASAAATAPAAKADSNPARTGADVIKAATAGEWRDVEPRNLLIMDLPQGQVLIELAERFAPRHVANIRTLAHNGYWNGLTVLRVQDNYVAQWGDPNGDDEKTAKPLAPASAKLPAEFSIPFKGLPINKLPDVDGWAPVSGFVDGFAVAANPKQNKAWLAHCYGVVGAGRGETVDSSTGAELYAMISPARGLDLNITVVGRVLKGMEFLAALQRGGPNMGFYDQPEQRTTIKQVRLASDLPESERPHLQLLRTDSKSWDALLDTRRHRGGWFVHSPEHVDVCGATVPMRDKPAQ
ncbi:peptidylprolyl isomerase [Paucibacter sp. APW11]|uniref:peptidylprolyl isomerase n=1 Tax=Roseateles aquae TaxID=3077235 RepID=A0ABU3P690_9BURK|nr:peptidylprolyl isomerase [Paucibacter sp. APW11]MDT8998086.1 peptidylprolyl isomerase [Paucibacter sp. APW11]